MHQENCSNGVASKSSAMMERIISDSYCYSSTRPGKAGGRVGDGAVLLGPCEMLIINWSRHNGGRKVMIIIKNQPHPRERAEAGGGSLSRRTAEGERRCLRSPFD